jgi:hypothetical protein
MTPDDFEDRWTTAVELCGVRGWACVHSEFITTVFVPLDDRGGLYRHTCLKNENGLLTILRLLEDGPPMPMKVSYRFGFGSTDPRAIYGSTST